MSAWPDPGHPAGPGAPRLARLQRGFIREVLYREDTGLAAHVAVDAGKAAASSAARRIGIYRSNARENFAEALAAAFPLLEACVGLPEFRRLAWSYQRAHPSRAGNLFHIGRGLPRFLGEHVRGSADEYLIDVASLEWLIQEALAAADADASIDVARLATVPAEQQGNLRLEVHPSVRLLASDSAVFHLWAAHQATLRSRPAVATTQPRAAPLPLPPPREREHLLVQRQAEGVRLHRLAERDYRWLSAAKQGTCLAALADLLHDAGSDSGAAILAGLLQSWIRQDVVIGFVLPDTAA